MPDEPVSRRGALAGGAAALAGAAAALAVSTVTREAHADNASDAAALNTVLTTAYQIALAYQTGLAVASMPDGATVAALLTHFQTQHRDEATALAARITALGGTPVSMTTVLPPNLPAGFTLTPGNWVKYSCNLEKKAAIDLVTKIASIGSKDAAELVAAVAATQTQRFVVMYLLAKNAIQAGPMAASMINEIVPRSFANVDALPAQSLSSVTPLPFTT